MKRVFREYIKELKSLMDNFQCTTSTGAIATEQGVKDVIAIIEKLKEDKRKILWIGNGGSAAIASHSTTDYFRTDNIRTLCFSDASLLTCLGNDLGYPAVFAAPIESHGEPGDLLIAISSSGQSANILNAVEAGKRKGCTIVTLSGFAADNPLRQQGRINFYVPSHAYGHVELVHGILCHSFLDLIMKGRK